MPELSSGEKEVCISQRHGGGNSFSEGIFQNTPSRPNRNRFGAARASLSKLPNPHPLAVCPQPPPEFPIWQTHLGL